MMLEDLLRYKIIDLEFPREVGMPSMPTTSQTFRYKVVQPSLGFRL